jgi:hypothetical protein
MQTFGPAFGISVQIPYFCIMEVQGIIVLILFLAALVYVGRSILSGMRPQKGCGGNCKCGVDFSSIAPEKKLN